jgi:UDP-glucose 4-epimerase
MRTLVTGGAGFIGSHLVERLLADGHRVRVLDDFSTGTQENLAGSLARIELFPVPASDRGSLARAVQGAEIVFHLAALPSVARSAEAPLATHPACATSTLEVLDACRLAGVRRVVYASSSSVYGDAPGIVRSESDPLAPLSVYAASKLAGEYCCQAFGATYGLDCVRLRFFNVFGPRQRADSPYSGAVPRFARALLAGERPQIHGDGEQSRDFTFVDDVVRALVLAAHAPAAAGQAYNIGAGRSTSVAGLLAALQAVLGTEAVPLRLPARPGDVRHSRADISKAGADLGYAPRVPLEEGLRRTVAWLRSEGA